MMEIFVTCLPTILSLVGFGLKKAGAHADTLAAFQNLIEHTKNDGAVATVQAKAVFADQKKQLDAMFDPPVPPKV